MDVLTLIMCFMLTKYIIVCHLAAQNEEMSMNYDYYCVLRRTSLLSREKQKIIIIVEKKKKKNEFSRSIFGNVGYN